MAKKNNLTPTQKKKRYSRIEKGLFVGQFAALFTPFITIGIINYDEYFTQVNGTKVSIGFIMAMIILGIATFGISKKKMESTYATFILRWAVATLLFWFLDSIIHDISFILLMGLFGILAACGLDAGSKKAKKKKEEVIAGIEKAKQEEIASAYKEETKK